MQVELGQKYFVNLLNKKAAALGMDGTAIVDPTGVSMSNVTTAKDIFALAKALFSYRHFILDMSRNPESAMNYGQIAFSNLQRKIFALKYVF